ncbi:MAG: type II restriction endonuclease [Pseudomonadota bacterium]|nr:type II restriction endonuclease [Pseudomonadota bacterium]
MEEISRLAVDATLKSIMAYCKFLAANDTGETKSHQEGFLINKCAQEIMFSEAEFRNEHIQKKDIKVRWQNDFTTGGCFTWYESKGEFRLTKMGRGFPFKNPEYTGALFVLTKTDDVQYEGYILNTENEINEYLDAFGLTPAETNRIVELKSDRVSALTEENAISSFIQSLKVDFPASEDMSAEARKIYCQTKFHKEGGDLRRILKKPDNILLEWTDEEYKLFKALEHARYGDLVSKGFSSVDEFVSLANQVLNRRKSRAGKSLEHHLSAIFDANKIRYTAQGVTEGNKKPDFVFPSIDDYHNMLFSVDGLCTLAAKTTCKDRWRQVLNEADRLRDRNKYLCTLQQGISSSQLKEMHAEKVVLVVPGPYLKYYPNEYKDKIWKLSKFVDHVRELEGL